MLYHPEILATSVEYVVTAVAPVAVSDPGPYKNAGCGQRCNPLRLTMAISETKETQRPVTVSASETRLPLSMASHFLRYVQVCKDACQRHRLADNQG